MLAFSRLENDESGKSSHRFLRGHGFLTVRRFPADCGNSNADRRSIIPGHRHKKNRRRQAAAVFRNFKKIYYLFTWIL